MKVLQEIPRISEKMSAPTASSTAKLTPVILRDISLLSWIVGQSSILRVVLHRTCSMAMAKLVSSLRKFGQYYRGCEQLHNAILKSNLNRPYQALVVRHVPSPDPESHKMYNDWYQTLDLIYYRTRQRDMLISRSQFVTSYPSINEYHNEWPTQMFVRHAEVCLIDNLMKLGKRPTEFGVSKFCCRACYVWINAVNKTVMEKGRRENWAVSGTHGKYYPWQRDTNSPRFEAEREVLQDLYDQLAGKVDLVLGPTVDSDEGSEEGASARVRSSAAKEYRKRRLLVKATFSGS